MWPADSRDRLPGELGATEWDVLVIGGGITGAGILLEAARQGLKALLVEQRDFAWGTSSRSSKLVHGGLRYIKEGKLLLTRDAVRERQNLLAEAPGLVEPQGFAFADYAGRKPGRRLFSTALAIYDLLAGQRSRRYHAADDFLLLAPHIRREDLNGGLSYADAKTDDARLVLRVLQEAVDAGGTAVNYLGVTGLRRGTGNVTGAELRDGCTGAIFGVNARVVINATGAWADSLRKVSGTRRKLRPLRGSHLVLPAWRLPIAQAISLMHPLDGRPVFAFPWEGATLVGTTDVDHGLSLQQEAAITPEEFSYLMTALEFQFPALAIRPGDVIATYAGVRPVVDSGKADPSKEGRDHAVWLEDGLLTVTGGKLTTFRLIALDAMKHATPFLSGRTPDLRPKPIFPGTPPLARHPSLTNLQRRRLEGRYGRRAAQLVALAQPDELAAIPGTETLWAELRWAARSEAVIHLDDLLLRRTRIGLLLRQGGAAHMERIRAICQPALAWSDARWHDEQRDYLARWQRHYAVPPQHLLPDWRNPGAVLRTRQA